MVYLGKKHSWTRGKMHNIQVHVVECAFIAYPVPGVWECMHFTERNRQTERSRAHMCECVCVWVCKQQRRCDRIERSWHWEWKRHIWCLMCGYWLDEGALVFFISAHCLHLLLLVFFRFNFFLDFWFFSLFFTLTSFFALSFFVRNTYNHTLKYAYMHTYTQMQTYRIIFYTCSSQSHSLWLCSFPWKPIRCDSIRFGWICRTKSESQMKWNEEWLVAYLVLLCHQCLIGLIGIKMLTVWTKKSV